MYENMDFLKNGTETGKKKLVVYLKMVKNMEDARSGMKKEN